MPFRSTVAGIVALRVSLLALALVFPRAHDPPLAAQTELSTCEPHTFQHLHGHGVAAAAFIDAKSRGFHHLPKSPMA